MCGVFDITCHVQEAIAPWLWWIKVGGIVFVGLVLLWVVAKIKAVAGTPGVIAFLTAIAYGLGYWRGKKGDSFNLLPKEDSKPKKESKPKPKKVGDRVYDADTNSWKPRGRK